MRLRSLLSDIAAKARAAASAATAWVRARFRLIVGRAWAALGQRLYRSKRAASPAVGFVSVPGIGVGLWDGLKVVVVAGGLWWAYSTVYDRGYEARDAEYQAALKEANDRIAGLNIELDAEKAKDDERLEAVAANAVVGILDRPQCVKTECALPADAIARLNEVD